MLRLVDAPIPDSAFRAGRCCFPGRRLPGPWGLARDGEVIARRFDADCVYVARAMFKLPAGGALKELLQRSEADFAAVDQLPETAQPLDIMRRVKPDFALSFRKDKPEFFVMHESPG